MTLRRTRIICTLGPASSSRATLRALIAAGMDIARVNFSHGTEAEHRETVEDVRAVATQTGRHIALLQDLQGPKIRTGRLVRAPVRLRRGELVTLTARDVVGDENLIPVSHPAFIRSLLVDERVLLADGEIELRIRSLKGGEALCTVARGGLLGERKGVAAPNCPIRLPALTAKDVADLRLGAELRFDYLALSFVRSSDDLVACRRAMKRVGWQVPLIAKLERPQALTHLDGILTHADGVMVARGDLGVELSLAEVPAAQKDIIERANLRGVPVITATEMLESMVTSNRPTRAEASDVANAIWDGTDAVMLSAETSIGAHPVESVRAMAAICRAAEAHPSYRRARPLGTVRGSVGSAIAHSAATVADELGAAAIVAFTETGSTALRVSKRNPTVPIIAASPHAETLRRTALYAGVIPLLVEHGVDTDDLILKAGEAAIRSGLVSRRDRVVIIAGVSAQPGQTNLLKVVTIR
ncbi:MAG: pyruvate kinase [Candidatus Dormibacteraeota bacterium]|nr:pyruvate kinase [Candidatus Dormibacteraeota bacterium]